MRSIVAPALLGLATLGGTLALPAKADASWLSEALHGYFDPGYYGAYYPGYYDSYGYYTPGYSYYTPGYRYDYSPGYVVPYYGPRSYGGSRWHGGWHRGWHGHHDGHHGWHGHYRHR